MQPNCKLISTDKKCQNKKPISYCSSKNITVNSSDLAFLVDDYFKEYENSYEEEDKWWGEKNVTWEEVLKRGWQSRFENGKMHSHQRRVAHKLDEGLEVSLSDNIQPNRFNDFHSVYSWIKSVTDRVKGLGNTTAYDVARRLGVWVGVHPIMVYLHAGAATGAKKLGVEGKIVSLNDFPLEIQKLGATHAENFLCIYKNFL